ncbi:unnamed protein product [Symbiodinium sp. CCMP2456]|nr:unnamed protein product [Symbiodinium sp. CCMP2456]
MTVMWKTVRWGLLLDNAAPDDYSTADCIGLTAGCTSQDDFPTMAMSGLVKTVMRAVPGTKDLDPCQRLAPGAVCTSLATTVHSLASCYEHIAFPQHSPGHAGEL